MGAEATDLSKYRYHEVFMASGDDIDGPSPWKCGGSMWKFVEVFFSRTHILPRPVLETCPCTLYCMTRRVQELEVDIECQ